MTNKEIITMSELDRIIKSRKSMSAGEMEDLLNSCPEWVEQNREREARHRARAEQRAAEMMPEMRPLETALREAGFEFQTLSDFVNSDQSFPAAIPIFLKHLQTATHATLRTVIGRCLSGSDARGLAGPVLVKELKRNVDGPDVRWLFANAFTATATQEDVEGLQELIADSRNESIRERLQTALKSASKR